MVRYYIFLLILHSIHYQIKCTAYVRMFYGILTVSLSWIISLSSYRRLNGWTMNEIDVHLVGDGVVGNHIITYNIECNTFHPKEIKCMIHRRHSQQGLNKNGFFRSQPDRPLGAHTKLFPTPHNSPSFRLIITSFFRTRQSPNYLKCSNNFSRYLIIK